MDSRSKAKMADKLFRVVRLRRGYQIERSQYMVVKEADNYTDAADKFVANVGSWLNQFRYDWGVGDFPLVTSDYVLYDFDYKAGYDAVFADP